MQQKIERFLTAQERDYARALSELKNGLKVTHWMWYIFPQLRFLGKSETAYYYGIADEAEAIAYCQNPVLRERYIACCQALDGLTECNPKRIMGEIDAIKLRSSLTLFYMVDGENGALYQRLIDKFYQGKWDSSTVQYIQARRTGKA